MRVDSLVVMFLRAKSPFLGLDQCSTIISVTH